MEKGEEEGVEDGEEDDEYDEEGGGVVQRGIAAVDVRRRHASGSLSNQKSSLKKKKPGLLRMGTVHEYAGSGKEVLYAKAYKFFYLLGAMDWVNEWVGAEVASKPLRVVLWSMVLVWRGLGQVMFMNSPLTGLCIMAAAFWQDAYVAVFMMVGCAGSTCFAVAVGADWKAVSAGLFGYNGALVGLAMGTFGTNVDFYWVGVTLFISALSTIWLIALSNVLSVHLHVPVLTLPFNLACFLFFFGSSALPSFNVSFTPNAEVPVQAVRDEGALGAYYDAMLTEEMNQLAASVVRGFGQIFFFDELLSGGLVVLGAMLCSPLGTLLGLLGVVLGTLTGVVCGADSGAIYAGLWGYNACLGAIAVGGMFFVFSKKSVVLAALCAVCCALASPALQTFWLFTGVPVLTMPFCVMTLPFLLLGDSLKGLEPVPLTRCTYPEDNYLHFHLKPAAPATRRAIFH
jgi:solute carrier family 14 (urea transporter)